MGGERKNWKGAASPQTSPIHLSRGLRLHACPAPSSAVICGLRRSPPLHSCHVHHLHPHSPHSSSLTSSQPTVPSASKDRLNYISAGPPSVPPRRSARTSTDSLPMRAFMRTSGCGTDLPSPAAVRTWERERTRGRLPTLTRRSNAGQGVGPARTIVLAAVAAPLAACGGDDRAFGRATGCATRSGALAYDVLAPRVAPRSGRA